MPVKPNITIIIAIKGHRNRRVNGPAIDLDEKRLARWAGNNRS
jgi:hypothetical protein